jgi:hypothetical protein
MSLRREAALLLALAGLAACAPEVTQEAPKQEIVFAAFAPPSIPLPNDLALATVPTDGAAVNTAQLELLNAFVSAGGFPSDQEVPVTIPFRRVTWTGTAYAPATPPPVIDLATVTPSTVAIFKVDGGTPTPQAYEVAGSVNGTLTLRKQSVAGSRRWAPGRYVVAVRGGASGVKTTGGLPIEADQIIELVKPNKPLGVRENQPVGGLSAAQVTQLEAVRAALWNPVDWNDANGASAGGWAPGAGAGVVPAFVAAQSAFPLAEVAAVSTFEVAPATTSLLTDSGSGTVPLPSDFLLVLGNPAGCPANATNPNRCVRNLSAFGPAAPGIATLDGFSTTAPLLIPTTAPVSVPPTAPSVFVVDVGSSDPAAPPQAPVLLRDVVTALGAGQPGTARYGTGASGASLALQVASPLTLDPDGPGPSGPITLNLPPLDGSRRYAVIVTNRVRDAGGNPIVRSTLGKILWGFTSPLYDAGTNTSLIPGVAPADAAGLQALRDGLNPLLAALPALAGDATLTRDTIVMAYTVTTQTVTATSSQLSAAPYAIEAGAGQAVFAVTGPPTTPAFPGSFPNVVAFREFPMNTLFAIDLTTGAIDRDAIENPVPVSIPVLMAFPAAAAVPACPGDPAQKCAPVVLFHHGLGGNRTSMLAVADRFAQAGMVVAAIDAPYHGARGFCQVDTDCGTGGVCTHPDDDGDVPGTCTTGTLQSPTPRYFISENFFRTRDAIRHTLLDYSALALAVARPPAPYPQPAANPVALTATGLGYAIDPTQVHFTGASLGGIIGTSITATNPRIQRSVLNVPGATMFDVFTRSPAFAAQVDPLLAAIVPGYTRAAVTPGDPAFDLAVFAAFTQTSAVAKWILDPADPLNYADRVETKLVDPALVTQLGPTASATAQVYAQMVTNDGVIPNPFSRLLFARLGAAVDQVEFQTDATPAAQLHSLIGVPSPQGAAVRDALATFLTTGTAPQTGTVNLDP